MALHITNNVKGPICLGYMSLLLEINSIRAPAALFSDALQSSKNWKALNNKWLLFYNCCINKHRTEQSRNFIIVSKIRSLSSVFFSFLGHLVFLFNSQTHFSPDRRRGCVFLCGRVELFFIRLISCSEKNTR